MLSRHKSEHQICSGVLHIIPDDSHEGFERISRKSTNEKHKMSWRHHLNRNGLTR